jgi:hypothetical protein
MPASSRIRAILNLSLRLFLAGRLFPLVASDSWPSSSLLNIISGLLPTVAIDEFVFRRCPLGDIRGGEVTVSFCCEVLRESQEKGLVSFLVGGAAAKLLEDCVEGGGGGGAQGIDGSAPDSPCSDPLDDLGGRGGFESFARTSTYQNLTTFPMHRETYL